VQRGDCAFFCVARNLKCLDLTSFLTSFFSPAQQQEDLQSKLAEQQKQINALTFGLEKVNNRLELNKPARQIALNNQ
jgi:hypothetical protein